MGEIEVLVETGRGLRFVRWVEKEGRCYESFGDFVMAGCGNRFADLHSRYDTRIDVNV